MTDEPVFRVRVEGRTKADLRAFADETGADLGCRAVARRSTAGVTVDAYLAESQLAAARSGRAAAQVSMTVLENQTETSRERQAEVGEGDRFAARGEIPRGLGRKE